MQIGFTYTEAAGMPIGQLLDYIDIDNINKYDYKEKTDPQDEFDRLLDFE